MDTRRFAENALRLAGWHGDGELPPPKKYVCLAVPHTSRGGGLLLVLLAQSQGLPLSWMIKDPWFRGPMAPLLRNVGAVAVDRKRSRNIGAQMIEAFARRDELVLALVRRRGA